MRNGRYVPAGSSSIIMIGIGVVFQARGIRPTGDRLYIITIP